MFVRLGVFWVLEDTAQSLWLSFSKDQGRSPCVTGGQLRPSSCGHY